MTFNPQQYPYLSQQFPHVIEKVILLWGYPEFYIFINKLLLQSRNENRQGFPPEVLKDILQMETDHEKIIPNKKVDWFYH